MIIRGATAQDVPAIVDIWNHYILKTAVTFTTRAKTCEALTADIEGRSKQGLPFLVAVQQDKVVGFTSYAPFRGGPGYRYTMEHSVMLTPDECGAGLGGTLLDAIEGFARDHKVHCLIAGVSGENQAAVLFHQKRGYLKVGCLRDAGYKFDRWMDLILLQKVLN